MSLNRDIRSFQRAQGLTVDGQIGPKTWAALMASQGGGYAPTRPPFRPLTTAQKKRAFGDPTRGVALEPGQRRFRPNPEWKRENIISVELDHPLPNGRERVWLHRKAAAPFQGMWSDWHAAGVAPRTYHGSIAFRMVRGGRSLSSHAFGIGLDFNARDNGLGREPAPMGHDGCVLEMVKIAHAHGFIWGGHFRRKDGMHFELARV